MPAADGMVLPLDVTLRSTMTVPDSGEFAWHVNPSLRPSQYLTTHVRESWTVTCGGDGSSTAHEVVVTVGRGEAAPADMTACPAPS
jgi:hypothetical protein